MIVLTRSVTFLWLSSYCAYGFRPSRKLDNLSFSNMFCISSISVENCFSNLEWKCFSEVILASFLCQTQCSQVAIELWTPTLNSLVSTSIFWISSKHICYQSFTSPFRYIIAIKTLVSLESGSCSLKILFHIKQIVHELLCIPRTHIVMWIECPRVSWLSNMGIIPTHIKSPNE